jgi:hypothetical protein
MDIACIFARQVRKPIEKVDVKASTSTSEINNLNEGVRLIA